MILVTLASAVLFTILVQVNSKFCKEFKEVDHEFYPLRHCQRSNKSIIAFLNVDSVKECADFSRNHRGLAFNFSPVERRMENFYKNKSSIDLLEFYSCEVLKCPEYSNFSSMVNDTRYDYYSLYTHPPREFEGNFINEKWEFNRFTIPASGDATCVPSVGMFVLIKARSNYSVARSVCASLNSNLAHIASELRNYELSKMLKVSTNNSIKERTAYVGLNETSNNNFLTSDNEPLRCFNFRAWAPGHPADIRRPGCVAITPESSWKVFNCKRKLMSICELLTSGPNPFINNIYEKCSIRKPNNRLMPRKTSTD